MKIKIQRSFYQTKQINSFEPIKSGCAAEVEFDNDPVKFGEDPKLMTDWSQQLDRLVRAEVAKTIKSAVEELKPLCANCNGKSDRPLSREGICSNCEHTLGAQAGAERQERKAIQKAVAFSENKKVANKIK